MKTLLKSLTFLFLFLSLSYAAGDEPQANKLIEMLKLYYLPYQVDFKQGPTINEVIAVKADSRGVFNRLISTEEMQGLDQSFNQLKQEWKQKSLLLSTDVPVNGTVRISNRLISHHIPASRSALDGLKLEEKIQLQKALGSKPKEVQAIILQRLFLRNLLAESDSDRFNLFMIAPHWCESSKEYRALIEAYLKRFPNRDLAFHSVVVEDPKEDIFDSQVFSHLFPNPKKYTHESVPRFISLEIVDGEVQVQEEGNALQATYARFFAQHRGFAKTSAPLPTIDPVPQVAAK